MCTGISHLCACTRLHVIRKSSVISLDSSLTSCPILILIENSSISHRHPVLRVSIWYSVLHCVLKYCQDISSLCGTLSVCPIFWQEVCSYVLPVLGVFKCFDFTSKCAVVFQSWSLSANHGLLFVLHKPVP